MSKKLYSWQAKAKKDYLKSQKRIFSLCACPGSGKTRFALSLVQHLLRHGEIDAVVITVHNISLRLQWMSVANSIGLNFSQNLREMNKGAVVTHQQYSQNPTLIEQTAQICQKKRIFLISDEHHHLADNKSWGEAMVIGFAKSKKILLLSGTLFRHDDGVIPFVSYNSEGISQPDYEYGYKQALSDRVVAPIYFPIYGGKAQWRYGRDGSIASFGDELSLIGQNQQLTTAITSHSWINVVLTEAAQKLQLLKKSHPKAAGLLIGKDIEHARYLADLLENLTGKPPILAISDETDAHQQIINFTREESEDDWLVAIKMVTEGIDIPRLRVGVFATNVTTELFFRQLVGRLIRISPNCSTIAPNYLYLPGHNLLINYAQNYAIERSHVLNAEDLNLSQDNRILSKERELFEPLSATGAIALRMISPVSPAEETPIEQLDRALLRLNWILDETTNLKTELTNLRSSLVRTHNATDNIAKSLDLPEPETKLAPPTQKVLEIIARHRLVKNLTLQQLSFLCELNIVEVNNAICALRLEGLIENMELTPRGKTRLGQNLPQAIECEADIIKLWLIKLPEHEQRLLKSLFALNRRVDMDEWATAANYGSRSLTQGKPLQARQNLVKLRLVIEGKISRKMLYSLNPGFQKEPLAY